MSRTKGIWVRYTWDLQGLSTNSPRPTGYLFRSAAPGELNTVIDVVLSAYRSDPIWEPLMADIKQRMTERILTTLAAQETDYLAAEHRGRLVAVSGVAASHWTDQNLLTGICVLPNHQRRGVGKYLLERSLWRLREMGLQQARVYTQAGSLADRTVYPLFGPVREENVEYPGAQPSDRSTV